MSLYKSYIIKLAKSLFKLGKTKEVYLLTDLVNQADDQDKGKEPWVVDIEKLTKDNENFRTTEWTGQFLQMTVMSLKPGEDVGLEIHNDVDQFLRIESGKGLVEMGSKKEDLNESWEAEDDFAIFVPAGTWHNITNIGETELKLYSIYTPPEHPAGTVHKTKEESEEDHED